jgi:hypothetical protein
MKKTHVFNGTNDQLANALEVVAGRIGGGMRNAILMEAAKRLRNISPKVIEGEIVLGASVRLSAAGRAEYEDDWSNPHDGFGTLITIRSDEPDAFVYRVMWPSVDGSITNVYRIGELEMVEV